MAGMNSVPPSLAALRQLPARQVQRLTSGSETMPGLMISNGSGGTLFYDLTAMPPVFRTLPPGAAVSTEVENIWSHQQALIGYSDEELEQVLQYLTELMR